MGRKKDRMERIKSRESIERENMEKRLGE